MSVIKITGFRNSSIMGVSLFWSEFLSVWLFLSKTVLFCFLFNQMRVLGAGTLLPHPYWTNLCGQRPAMLFEVRLKYKWFYYGSSQCNMERQWGKQEKAGKGRVTAPVPGEEPASSFHLIPGEGEGLWSINCRICLHLEGRSRAFAPTHQPLAELALRGCDL